MQTVEQSKHDIKNIYVKVLISSDFDLKMNNTRKYLKVLREYKDSKILELSLREKINNILIKFKYEEIEWKF